MQQRIYISSKLPDIADVTGPGTPFWFTFLFYLRVRGVHVQVCYMCVFHDAEVWSSNDPFGLLMILSHK